jgi:hypothetical protein
MIKASELREKYFGEDLRLKDLDSYKSHIEKEIDSAAKDRKDSITVALPRRYKKTIAEWLEDNEYTVFGVNSDDNSLDIFWAKELVEQMI